MNDILKDMMYERVKYQKKTYTLRVWSFSGHYFPAFELNTNRYSVSLRIQFEYGKIRIRKTLNTGTFQILILIFYRLFEVP